MRTLYTIIVGSLITLGLSSCERKLCQNSPPQYNFAFVTAQQKPVVADSLQAASLRLTYYSSTGIKTSVALTWFTPYPSDGPSKYVYRIAYELIDQVNLNKPTVYTLELNGQAINKLSLTTQKNNTDCDGWMHLTEVRSNQIPISISSDNLTYSIQVDL